jgi:hypothetical protein
MPRSSVDLIDDQIIVVMFVMAVPQRSRLQYTGRPQW